MHKNGDLTLTVRKTENSLCWNKIYYIIIIKIAHPKFVDFFNIGMHAYTFRFIRE